MASGRARLPAACFVVVILAASRACLAPPKPQASKPTGRWHIWVNWEGSSFLGGNDKHLWFGGGPGCWRYDVKSRRVQAYTLINTWFNSFGPQVTFSPDGRVAWLNTDGRHVDLWREGLGWRRLPDPPLFQTGLQRIALDNRGRLLGIGPQCEHGHRLLELTGRAWRTIGHVPVHFDFIPMGNGYFLTRGDVGPHWFLATLGAKPRRYPPEGEVKWLRPVLRAGGKLYGKSTQSIYGLVRPQTLVEITPERPVPRATGLLVGVDLTGKGFLTFTGTEQVDRVHWRGHVTTPEGKKIPVDDVEVGAGRILIRDANGHIWIGPRRWDGRRWQQVVPENHLPGIRRPEAAGVQLHLNPKTMTWSRQHRPGIPEDVGYYDTASKTGWTCEYKEGLYRYRLLDFSAKSPRELARYKSEYEILSFYHTPGGDWWWHRSPNTDNEVIKLFRLSKGAKPRTYSSGLLTHGLTHYLHVSPKGSLWLLSQAGWSRFDVRRDAFVPGEPYDEYAVRLGEWTVACIGTYGPQASGVFIKVRGRWKPMMNPFGADPLCGTSQFVHGDRMIAFYPGAGIMEYDATHDRWARLHSRTVYRYSNRARFDKHGQRFLTLGGYLLHYDSDPFTPPDAAERTRRRQFDLLLKRLDADQWRDRDAAMAELTKRLAEFRPWLVTAMYRRLSPEVRTRVQLLLQNRKVAVPGGPALFDRMRKLPIPAE